MVYQPKIAIDSGKMVGAEALLRWKSPSLGDISPMQFIPVAEGCGLINSLGEIVFKQVLAQVAQWHREGLSPPRIAINVSAHQLRSDTFPDRVEQWLQEAGGRCPGHYHRTDRKCLDGAGRACQDHARQARKYGHGYQH